MNTKRRIFLRHVMQQAWSIYRQRHIPGAVAQTFAAALRRAWAWVSGANDRETARQAWATRPQRTFRLAPMDVSPIRRSLSCAPYGSAEATRRGYLTSALGR